MTVVKISLVIMSAIPWNARSVVVTMMGLYIIVPSVTYIVTCVPNLVVSIAIVSIVSVSLVRIAVLMVDPPACKRAKPVMMSYARNAP